MRKTLQRITLCGVFFCGLSLSALGRICERVAVPQPHDEIAQKIFQVSKSEAFLGTIRWRFLRWGQRQRSDLQQKALLTQKTLYDLLAGRDYQARVVVKEDLRSDIRLLEARLESRVESPIHVVADMTTGSNLSGAGREWRHLDELKARWQLAPLHAERAALIAEYEVAIRREADSLSAMRLELLKHSELWGKEVISIHLIQPLNEAGYLEIEDSQGRFFTWQPHEDEARLATVVID